MSAPTINITAPMVPGAAGGAGKAAGGAGAGFEAMMGAFFASTDGVLQTAATAVPAVGAAATGALATGEAATGVPADATAAALLMGAAQAAGALPADAGDAGAPKLPVPPTKTPDADAGQLLGQATPAAADPAQPPQTIPAARAASAAAAAVDAAVIVTSQTPASDDAAEAPTQADPLNPAQMTAVLALLAPIPAPPPAAARPAAAPEPTGSPRATPAVEALPLPAASTETTQAAATAAEPKLDMLADKAPEGAAPASAPAQPASPRAEPAKTASAPTAAAPTLALPAETTPPATAQAAVAPAAPAAPSAEKPAKPARAGREEATPHAAATDPAVRPGPASTVGAAAQADTNKDPGQGSTNTPEPQLAETRTRAADPQPMGDPAAPPPPAAATSAQAAAAAAVRGSPETVANLAAQILKKLGARSTHFDLQLDPVGLGRVNVRVAINADGRVSAAMSFDNPQAAAELKSRANELQRALAQSGFDLTGGLTFDVAQDQGGRASSQQNGFQNNDNPGHAFRGRAFAAALENAGDAAQAALIDRRATPSGVDVRI